MSPVVVIALLSSLFYGASDFMGAVAARRLPLFSTSAAIYTAATITAAIALALVPWSFSVQAFWSGVIAGLFATVGMVAFYAALAIGPISLLSPMIALTQAVVPVAFAATTGRSPSPIAWVAVGLAVVATSLISIPSGAQVERISLKGATLGLLSGLTLGLSVVALDFSPNDSGLFPAFLDLAVGVVILIPLALVARRRRASAARVLLSEKTGAAEPSVRTLWLITVGAGVLLGVGNSLLVAALHSGNLAVVAVLVSLYPLATVVLAWAVLKERISLLQFGGVLLAVSAAAILGLS